MIGKLIEAPVLQVVAFPAVIVVIVVVVGSEGAVVPLLRLFRGLFLGGSSLSLTRLPGPGQARAGGLECLYRLTHAAEAGDGQSVTELMCCDTPDRGSVE